MATRKELIEGVGKRYRTSNRQQKQQILEEFTRVTGYIESTPFVCSMAR